MQTLKIFSPLTFFFRKLLDVFPPNERISHRWEDTRSRRQKIQNKREAKKFQGDGKGKSGVRAKQQAQKESKLKQKDKRIQKSCHQRQGMGVGGEKEGERERGREKGFIYLSENCLWYMEIKQMIKQQLAVGKIYIKERKCN